MCSRIKYILRKWSLNFDNSIQEPVNWNYYQSPCRCSIFKPILSFAGVLHPGQKFVINLNESMVQLNHYKKDCASSQLSAKECQEVFLPSKVFDDRFTKRFGSRLRQSLQKQEEELQPGWESTGASFISITLSKRVSQAFNGRLSTLHFQKHVRTYQESKWWLTA